MNIRNKISLMLGLLLVGQVMMPLCAHAMQARRFDKQWAMYQASTHNKDGFTRKEVHSSVAASQTGIVAYIKRGYSKLGLGRYKKMVSRLVGLPAVVIVVVKVIMKYQEDEAAEQEKRNQELREEEAARRRAEEERAEEARAEAEWQERVAHLRNVENQEKADEKARAEKRKADARKWEQAWEAKRKQSQKEREELEEILRRAGVFGGAGYGNYNRGGNGFGNNGGFSGFGQDSEDAKEAKRLGIPLKDLDALKGLKVLAVYEDGREVLPGYEVSVKFKNELKKDILLLSKKKGDPELQGKDPRDYIKACRLKWHPDTTPYDKRVAQEGFKWIEQHLKKARAGLPKDLGRKSEPTSVPAQNGHANANRANAQGAQNQRAQEQRRPKANSSELLQAFSRGDNQLNKQDFDQLTKNLDTLLDRDRSTYEWKVEVMAFQQKWTSQLAKDVAAHKAIERLIGEELQARCKKDKNSDRQRVLNEWWQEQACYKHNAQGYSADGEGKEDDEQGQPFGFGQSDDLLAGNRAKKNPVVAPPGGPAVGGPQLDGFDALD